MGDSWVSWIDYIPVIGTVKESVECVAALIEGDYETAKIKGISAAIGLASDAFTLASGGTGAGAKIAVKGVSKAVSTAAIKTATATAAEAAIKNTLRIAGKLTADELRRQLKEAHERERRARPKDTEEEEDMKREAKRGEHIINNNVLRVMASIIEQYVKKKYPKRSFDEMRVALDGTRVLGAHDKPLIDPYPEHIQYDLKVYLEPGKYIDANSVCYGIEKEVLVILVVDYMVDAFDRGSRSMPERTKRNEIKKLIDEIINRELFVDQMALTIYRSRGGDMQKYERAKAEVVKMFRRLIPCGNNDEILFWKDELIGANAFLESRGL